MSIQRVMFLSYISSFIFLIYACASSTVFTIRHTDPELQPYYNSYKHLLNNFCKSGKYNQTDYYTIYLNENNDGIKEIGHCGHRINGFIVEISKPWFEGASEIDREQLLFHELSHCLIDREHDEDPSHYMYFSFSSIPRSIYYKQVINDIKVKCGK